MTEEKDLIPIKIEEAKSWFALAEISIILAGFMFALSGVYWTSSKDSLNTGIGLYQNTILNAMEIFQTSNENFNISNQELENITDQFLELQRLNINLSKSYIEGSQSEINLAFTLLIFGFILTAFSIIIWETGKYQISKLKKS